MTVSRASFNSYQRGSKKSKEGRNVAPQLEAKQEQLKRSMEKMSPLDQLRAVGIEMVESIPRSRHRNTLASSPLWMAVTGVLDMTKKNGAVPFEEKMKISVDKYPELDKYKSAKITMIAALKKEIKDQGLDNLISLTVRGNDLYLVGAP